jgi:predicted lactoylglutathione lyase/heme-degrading monooxygenase HmoA
MAVPPRLSFVTIGVDDVARSDAFYRALGWEVVVADGDDFRLFKTAGAWLGVYARSSLQRDMGRDLDAGSASMNAAMNLDSREQVDDAVRLVAAAGGEVVTAPHAMEWGGYSAYVADPDGHIWEIAHAPAWPITLDGRLDVTESEDVVVVFRSRRRPEAEEEYAALRPRIFGLAEKMPGFVEAKTFTAEDGEHVTIVRFDTAAQERAWRDQPEHRKAQQLGRERFYATYDIAICSLVEEHSFTSS